MEEREEGEGGREGGMEEREDEIRVTEYIVCGTYLQRKKEQQTTT